MKFIGYFILILLLLALPLHCLGLSMDDSVIIAIVIMFAGFIGLLLYGNTPKAKKIARAERIKKLRKERLEKEARVRIMEDLDYDESEIYEDDYMDDDDDNYDEDFEKEWAFYQWVIDNTLSKERPGRSSHVIHTLTNGSRYEYLGGMTFRKID